MNVWRKVYVGFGRGVRWRRCHPSQCLCASRLTLRRILYLFNISSGGVGTKDAESSTLEDRDLMMPVVGAVLWLARTWQLYIGIRPPNLRICEEGSPKIRLIDMVFGTMSIFVLFTREFLKRRNSRPNLILNKKTCDKITLETLY